MKLYFDQTPTLFSLRVTVTDTKSMKIVYHKTYPPHTFLQFQEVPPSGDYSDYTLTLPNLNHKTKELNITIDFGQTTSAQSSQVQVPGLAVEMYGKMDEVIEEQARLAHLAFVKSKSFE